MCFFHLQTSRNDIPTMHWNCSFSFNCSHSQKGDKQTLENYRPVPLLRICGKMLERLMFNKMFNFFIEKKLISPNKLISCYLSLMRYMNLLMWDSKFEASSLIIKSIWQGVAWWYHLQTNSKWNIKKITKPFGGFFFRKENNA